MISKVTIICFLLMIVLINLAQARFTEVPPPPRRPDQFHSKEELKKYLQKLHEYHLIVGRWRLRRSSYAEHPYLSTSDEDDVDADDLFKFFDMNKDHYISKNEFAQRLKLHTKQN